MYIYNYIYLSLSLSEWDVQNLRIYLHLFDGYMIYHFLNEILFFHLCWGCYVSLSIKNGKVAILEKNTRNPALPCFWDHTSRTSMDGLIATAEKCVSLLGPVQEEEGQAIGSR